MSPEALARFIFGDSDPEAAAAYVRYLKASAK